MSTKGDMEKVITLFPEITTVFSDKYFKKYVDEILSDVFYEEQFSKAASFFVSHFSDLLNKRKGTMCYLEKNGQSRITFIKDGYFCIERFGSLGVTANDEKEETIKIDRNLWQSILKLGCFEKQTEQQIQLILLRVFAEIKFRTEEDGWHLFKQLKGHKPIELPLEKD